MESFPTGVSNVDWDILMALDDKSLTQACQASRISRFICLNDLFWYYRTQKVYPTYADVKYSFIEGTSFPTWRDLYISTSTCKVYILYTYVNGRWITRMFSNNVQKLLNYALNSYLFDLGINRQHFIEKLSGVIGPSRQKQFLDAFSDHMSVREARRNKFKIYSTSTPIPGQESLAKLVVSFDVDDPYIEPNFDNLPIGTCQNTFYFDKDEHIVFPTIISAERHYRELGYDDLTAMIKELYKNEKTQGYAYAM